MKEAQHHNNAQERGLPLLYISLWTYGDNLKNFTKPVFMYCSVILYITCIYCISVPVPKNAFTGLVKGFIGTVLGILKIVVFGGWVCNL